MQSQNPAEAFKRPGTPVPHLHDPLYKHVHPSHSLAGTGDSGPPRATRHIRKMRGGAQAHLLAASDGNFYVVKVANNPQGRRILVNEWISTHFLRHLQVASPACSAIEATADFIAEFPQFCLRIGDRDTAIEPGLHFGSRYPGDPSVTSVFDFLPEAHLLQCVNRNDFAAILAFDRWTGNADARQAIFYRTRVKAANGAYEKPRLITSMIDHGSVFSGSEWHFRNAIGQGLHARWVVYEHIRSIDHFEPWLDRIAAFPSSAIQDARQSLPTAWVASDGEALDTLLERLYRRRQIVPGLIEDLCRTKPYLFPYWR